MIYVVLAVRDRAADVFGQPFFSTSVGGAIRSFSDEVNRADEKNTIYQHPDDFDLYQLGNYDDSTGAVYPSENGPRQIAVGKDLKR